MATGQSNRGEHRVGRAHPELFGDVRPVSTMVAVAGFIDPRWRLEIEAEAVVD